MRDWTLTTPLVNLIKTGAKVVHHCRYVTFQIVELTVPQKVLAAVFAQIQRFAAILSKPATICWLSTLGQLNKHPRARKFALAQGP